MKRTNIVVIAGERTGGENHRRGQQKQKIKIVPVSLGVCACVSDVFLLCVSLCTPDGDAFTWFSLTSCCHFLCY